MRYLIFHNNFSRPAGTERVLYNIIEHLINTNHQVTLVLSSKKNKLVFGIDQLPIEIIFLNCDVNGTSKFELLKSYFKVFNGFKKYIQSLNLKNNYTIISSNHLLSFAAYNAIQLTDKEKFKIIGCEHFSIHVAGQFSRYLRKFFYNKLDAIVSLTVDDTKKIQQLFNPKYVVTIPNAIPFKNEVYVGENFKEILAIGRYTYQKGFDTLLKAFSQINNEFSDWKLTIVGDDYGDKEMMLKLIKELNLFNVELKPSTEDIHKFYKSAAFYVMTSRFEGLPMVLLESLGFGLPIVSFDCPTGPKEVVDSSNGILVKDQDINEFALSMKKLIIDTELRTKLAIGAHIKANQFSKTNINSMWDNLFEKIWK